ncbi:MAG: Hsp20/alpha crystallin family protein [Deltaproteobacteria bacterium]|jgi:HSP20 family protein
MTDTESRALQAKEKKEVATAAEKTRPGPMFTPNVDIFETEKDIMVLADLPGVKADHLSIDLHDNVLTLSGEVASPEGEDETEVFKEYRTGRYFREFALSEVIDQAKIEAKLKDGVLRLTLPKVQPATPKKISVKTA